MAGFLHDLRGPEAARRLRDDATVLVPVGAVEQHGPHLPMSTDFVIADEVARGVIAALGDELNLWCLPTLPISKSNEHAWSAGTVWLSVDTMLKVCDDIGRCLADAGVRRVAFLNAHGGNSTLLNVVGRELRLAHGLLTFVLHPFPPPAYTTAATDDPMVPVSPDTEMGMGIHAGRDETALMLHLRPELVDLDRATRNVPEWLTDNEFVRFGGPVQFGWLSDDFGPDGHIGDPTGATAEEGRVLFTAAVDALCAQLREVASFDFPRDL
jgi:creatinine amidohydrolase